MANDRTKKEAFEWLVKKTHETYKKSGNYTSEDKIRKQCGEIAQLVNNKQERGYSKK